MLAHARVLDSEPNPLLLHIYCMLAWSQDGNVPSSFFSSSVTRPSPASLRSASPPASGRGEGITPALAPLPLAGEDGAARAR
jgi:hypothetical protein